MNSFPLWQVFVSPERRIVTVEDARSILQFFSSLYLLSFLPEIYRGNIPSKGGAAPDVASLDVSIIKFSACPSMILAAFWGQGIFCLKWTFLEFARGMFANEIHFRLCPPLWNNWFVYTEIGLKV